MKSEKLNQKEQHYADSRDAAEEIVSFAKDNIYLTMHKISEKHNKFGTYFLVDLTYSFNVPRDIMELESAKQELGQPDHQGIRITDSGDGTIQVDPNQMSIDDVDGEGSKETPESLPF